MNNNSAKHIDLLDENIEKLIRKRESIQIQINDLKDLKKQLISTKKINKNITTKQEKLNKLQEKEIRIEKIQRSIIIKKPKQIKNAKQKILNAIKEQDIIIKRGNAITLKKIFIDRLRDKLNNYNSNQVNIGLSR